MRCIYYTMNMFYIGVKINVQHITIKSYAITADKIFNILLQIIYKW
jgi:hypothetical protein